MSTQTLSRDVTRYAASTRTFLAAQPLTDRQQEVLDYMREFHAENDQLPPAHQIARHFGLKSANTVVQHLEALVRKRRLEANAVGKLRFVREA